MKKPTNIYNLLRLWAENKIPEGKNWKVSSVTAEGNNVIYSYRTIIAERETDDKVIFNTKKYSVTTTKMQNWLRALLWQAGYIHASETETPNRISVEKGAINR